MKKRLLLVVLFLFFSSSYAVLSDEKIGQMLIVGFRGDNINSKDFKKTLKQLQKGGISGVILFSKNIKSKNDLIQLNNKIHQANKITPFIAIDNEGGFVERYGFNHIKSAKEISKENFDTVKNEYSKMAELEKELKINFNFAPCVDLDINKNSIISKKERSFSANPYEVVKYSKIFIDEHNKRKIITSIKHFPGHGSTKGDTHKNFVDVTKSFSADELIPYKELKNQNKMNTVMISHIFNSNFDKNYPASLSSKTTKILINGIGFDGVIVSDDYDMGAIRKRYKLEDIITNAINAKINILVFSNNIDKYDKNLVKKYHQIVKKQLKKGKIKQDDIENSYNKIMELKKNLD